MSLATIVFALVAGYVGIVVLWHLAVSDSLYAFSALKVRFRYWWPHWKEKLALAFDRSRAAVESVARARPGSRRYLTGALIGAAVACLAIVVVAVSDFGSKGKIDLDAALGPHSAQPAPLHPSRPLAPPVAAARSHSGRSTRVTGQKPPSAGRTLERHTRVVSLVNVSARVAAPTSATTSTQAVNRDGPAPLRAPPGSSAPSPLAAP